METRVNTVVFDLDGTLIDSAPDIAFAVNAMLQEQRQPPLDLATVTSFVGNGLPKLVERVLNATGMAPDSHAARFADVLRYYHAEGQAVLTRPYPNVIATLTALQAAGTKMAICTNKPAAPARQVLDHLDMARFFDVVLGGDSLPTRKPDPEMLAECLRQLGTDTCAYVGDTEVDAETAQNGRQRFYLYTPGYRKSPVNQIPHHAAFDDFAELPALLTQN